MTSQRKCWSEKPPPAPMCSTSRPGVATSTSTADWPPPPPAPPPTLPPPPPPLRPRGAARGAPSKSARSSSQDAPSMPTARPTSSGVSAARVARTPCTCTASARVGSSTSARSRRTADLPSRCCSSGRAYASVFPDPVGAQQQMSPAEEEAAEASTIGTTAAWTGKQRRTPMRPSAASSRRSSASALIGGVWSPMMRAAAVRIQSGSPASSVTP
mmetsp:Transcript_37268/g.116707  ORF Transcript_37268/g.116707 Transcript_37268/m.116707 type:complete len:214 (-) Transcript_37268:353-994(-)